MRVVTKEEFLLEAGRFLNSIKEGAVFIYPTDTIYGIGCNALDSKAVAKIREAKERPKAPFSVIAPSIDWIEENCVVTAEGREWLEKFPGPYTLVFRLKNRRCVSDEVIKGEDSLGIRMPAHWTTRIAKEIGVPIVTTSVNKAGKIFMTSNEDLDTTIRPKVDFMIDEGEKKAKPSDVIFLNKDEVSVRERTKGSHYPDEKKI
ncbi:MAG: L-threonylcarbamoyladenylate synthase [Candidatus Woesearchaeota archaeon]